MRCGAGGAAREMQTSSALWVGGLADSSLLSLVALTGFSLGEEPGRPEKGRVGQGRTRDVTYKLYVKR